MTEATSPILFDAADRYANGTSDASIRPDLRMAFVAGAEWQWKRIDDKDEIANLREALQGLEWACEQLAATRSMEVYTAMIDGGQAGALLSLDARRQAARAALKEKADG